MADVTDMRGYVEALEAMGELRRFEGVDLNLEVGALTERAAEKEGPALLFDGFKGFAKGFRVISNAFRTCKRTGPAMGIPSDLTGVDYLYAWRKKLAAYKPVAVEQVEGGPVFDNQMSENEVDLYKFPTPTWHELDGGPYIGTGCGVGNSANSCIGDYAFHFSSVWKTKIFLNKRRSSFGHAHRLYFKRFTNTPFTTINNRTDAHFWQPANQSVS